MEVDVRQAVERRAGVGRWNEKGRLERHCYFGLRRASAHAGLPMLMSLAAHLDQFLTEARKGRSVR